MNISNIDNHSNAATLKRIEDFTTFLHRSFLDIKRMYKTQISLKVELKIDPSMNPINIRIGHVLNLVDQIDPKRICYLEVIDDKLNASEQNNSVVDDFKLQRFNSQSNETNLTIDEHINKYSNNLNLLRNDKANFMMEGIINNNYNKI